MAEQKLLPKHKRFDCLGLGIIPVDLLFTVNHYPKAGTKIDASSFLVQGGGPVPNVLIGLSRLGFKTALIAAVGSDAFGRMVIDELKRDGVEHRYMATKKEPSALAAGWIETNGGRRTMVLSREVFVKPTDIDLASLPEVKIVHLDGRDIPATMKLARWAKKRGICVSFDIGSIRNDVSAVFPYVDHLVVADSYAYPFTGAHTPQKAIMKLAKLCPGTIVITEGVRGSTGRESGNTEFIYQPAFRVREVDTTGAGDCYHAGYLYGLLKKYPIQERMRLGAAAGALKCTKPGARTGIPGEKQLLKFLKSNPTTY